jgi:hypothetical protein
VRAVEHERCAACGFEGSLYDDAALVTSIDDLRRRWRRLLSSAGAELRVRPGPTTWSAIEYAAHSRDITALHVFGVEQALAVDEPAYPAIDGDALIEASSASYGEEQLDTVIDQLDLEISRLRDIAANSIGDAWERGITVGDSRSTIRRLLEHALHDSLHHLDDVQRGFVTIRAGDVPR